MQFGGGETKKMRKTKEKGKQKELKWKAKV
jgi:hypothetical protein